MMMTIVITIMIIIIITIIVMIIVITIITSKNFTAVRRRITDQILSLKGQHTGSRRKTLEAAVRFSPTPPAFSDSSITVGESGPRSSNNSITSDLFFCDILPSNRTKLNPSAFSGVSTMFSRDVNWEMTRLFTEGSSFLSFVRRDISVSIWMKQTHTM